MSGELKVIDLSGPSAWTDFDMHDGWTMEVSINRHGLTFRHVDGDLTIPLPDIETVLNFIADSPYQELVDTYFPIAALDGQQDSVGEDEGRWTMPILAYRVSYKDVGEDEQLPPMLPGVSSDDVRRLGSGGRQA